MLQVHWQEKHQILLISILQSRLNILRENLISFNSSSNNNNNNNKNNFNDNNKNNNFLPPRPPPSPPPSPLKQDNFFQPSFSPQQTTSKQNIFGPAPRILPAPSATSLPPDDYLLINTKFGENVIEKTEKVIENIDNALNEVPEPPEIELGDLLMNVLSTKTDEILQDDYISDNIINEKKIEVIKDEYNFDQIKDTFSEGKVPCQLEFFFWQRQLKFCKCM